MADQRAPQRRTRARLVSLWTAGASALVCLLVLYGWQIHNQFLTSVRPTFTAMKPNTAITIALIALAVMLANRHNIRRSATLATYVLVAAAVTICTLTIIESVFGVSFHIDTILFTDTRTIQNPHPGRMAPAGAVALLGLAVAVLCLDRMPLISQIFGASAAVVGTASLLGFAYGSNTLHRIGGTAGVSLQGAIALLLLAIAVLSARPDRGPVMLLTADGAGGTLVRSLLVAVLALPPVVGWGVARLARSRDFDFSLAAAVMVSSLMVVGAAVSWHSARRLQGSDVERQTAERDLAALNQDLQRLIDERTASLRQSEQRQLAVSRTARDAIVTADEDGTITFANPSADLMFRWPSGALIGQSIRVIVPSALQPDHRAGFSAIKAAEAGDTAGAVIGNVVEMNGVRHDGSNIPVEIAMASWVEDGRPWYAGTIRDLTAHKQAEAARQELLNRYQRLADSGSEAVATEQDGVLIEVNRAFGHMFGYSADEILGQPLSQFVDFSMDETLEDAMDSSSGRTDIRRTVGLHRDGTRLVLEVSGTDVHIAGRPARTFTMQDVTASYRRDRLRLARFQVAGVLAGDHTWNDAADRIARELCQSLNWGLGEIWVVSHGVLTRSAVWYEDDELAAFARSGDGREYRMGRGLHGRAWSQGQAVWLPDIRLETRFDRGAAARATGVSAGIAFPIASRNEVLAVCALYSRDHIGVDDELALVLTDIGRMIGDNVTRQRLEAELRNLLEHRASHDPLTGLANRVLFQDRLQHAIDISIRSRATAGLLLLDLDQFKPVNDTFGHQAGDEVLIEVSRRLCDTLRASDTVARLGGDEFGVLIEGDSVTSDTLVQVSTKIALAIDEPFTTTAGTARIGVSIGAALVPEEADSVPEAMAIADAAMYADKTRPASRRVQGRTRFPWPR